MKNSWINQLEAKNRVGLTVFGRLRAVDKEGKVGRDGAVHLCLW